MLSQISIANYTIIDHLQLDFDTGLTVISGETGAGKSILIDALALVLGARADSTVIRKNCQQCDITACFMVTHLPAAQQWLEANELTSDDDCIIRRIITLNGRSKITINGTPCTSQQVNQLANVLVNIHSQHQHQLLLKNDCQRQLLDAFAGHDALCVKVKQLFQQWRDCQQQLDRLKNNNQDSQAQLELLRYQTQELNELNLTADEYQQLDQQQKTLSHAEQLLQAQQQMLTIINDSEHGILHALNLLLQHCTDIKNVSDTTTLSDYFHHAMIQIQEAEGELQHRFANTAIDPQTLHDIEQRLSKIHAIARKHHTAAQSLVTLQQQLQQQLEQLENADQRIEALQQALADIADQYRKTAALLSRSRSKAAKKLQRLVAEKIRSLAMPNGQFDIQCNHADTFSAQGLEQINFLVSTNPGQPLQPLNKVASGGELSRIALAIETITAEKMTTPILIFDEVDVGIGGGTAEIVGQLLKQLGRNAQVLCITHLPQVAAQGDQHLQVQKTFADNKTMTHIEKLNEQQRIDEIARMLGGVEITERTIAHAEEMLISETRSQKTEGRGMSASGREGAI